MKNFEIVSVWHLAAPREVIWQELRAVEDWPRWWSSVARVRTLAEGDGNGVGTRHAIDWRSHAPYLVRLETKTVSITSQREIVVRTTGDLDGEGIWRLDATDAGTQVTYIWRVLRFDRRWMRALSPLLRPYFAWNHRAVMAVGARGLTHHLADAGTCAAAG